MSECFVCHKVKHISQLQSAHIIGNRKVNRKLYGDKVIDSELNTLPACDLHCNSLIDLGSQEMDKERVALIIESEMDFDDKREAVEGIVRANLQRKLNKNNNAL